MRAQGVACLVVAAVAIVVAIAVAIAVGRTRNDGRPHLARKSLADPREAYRQPVCLPDIDPNLWLGNLDAARRAASGDLPFDAIVCTASTRTCAHAFDATGALRPGSSAFEMDFPDSPYIDEEAFYAFVSRAAAWIHRDLSRGRRTLVHCYAGMNRSAASVVAYCLLYKKGWTYDRAVAYVSARNREERHIRTLTNPTFRDLLRRLAGKKN